ncbi:MAG: signal peptidase II [Coxiellaceae bacterium]|nr:signal peptidase II [Coxiellaceae bacterium]|tara:strand:+ start:1891 stop:2373 length:483 start_codon:yes stop_codon:yes gene_type:complete
MEHQHRSAWPWLWLSLGIVVADQLSKWWMMKVFTLGESKTLLPFLNLRLAYNHGAAFSILSGAGGWKLYFLTAVSLFAVVIMLIWMRTLCRRDYWAVIGFSLVIGGALGNLIDRLFLGYVIDFIDFHIGSWHFATFNLADSAVSIGAVLLIIHFVFEERG